MLATSDEQIREPGRREASDAVRNVNDLYLDDEHWAIRSDAPDDREVDASVRDYYQRSIHWLDG
jgi:hypothetical protein